jgi:hypothetical protein
MDPDACLTEMLEFARGLREGQMRHTHWGDVDELCDRVLALDGWLSSGGFPPARWNRNPRGGADGETRADS